MQVVESLKICTLIGFFCPKHIKFMWKNTEELCFMALKSDAKFEETPTLSSKNYMKNLLNFHPTIQRSESFTSIGYFFPKYITFELKNTEELSLMTLNSHLKIEETLTLWFQKLHEKLRELSLEHLKVWKIVHWWALFVQRI